MKSVVYDAGVLVAAERSERRTWADHRTRLELGMVPYVPSVVVAQVSRSPRQVQLRRVLRGCAIVPLTEADAHRVGEILKKSNTSDVVDAAVVAVAVDRNADIQTSDTDDIERLVASTRARIRVLDV